MSTTVSMPRYVSGMGEAGGAIGLGIPGLGGLGLGPAPAPATRGSAARPRRNQSNLEPTYRARAAYDSSPSDTCDDSDSDIAPSSFFAARQLLQVRQHARLASATQDLLLEYLSPDAAADDGAGQRDSEKVHTKRVYLLSSGLKGGRRCRSETFRFPLPPRGIVAHKNLQTANPIPKASHLRPAPARGALKLSSCSLSASSAGSDSNESIRTQTSAAALSSPPTASARSTSKRVSWSWNVHPVPQQESPGDASQAAESPALHGRQGWSPYSSAAPSPRQVSGSLSMRSNDHEHEHDHEREWGTRADAPDIPSPASSTRSEQLPAYAHAKHLPSYSDQLASPPPLAPPSLTSCSSRSTGSEFETETETETEVETELEMEMGMGMDSDAEARFGADAAKMARLQASLFLLDRDGELSLSLADQHQHQYQHQYQYQYQHQRYEQLFNSTNPTTSTNTTGLSWPVSKPPGSEHKHLGPSMEEKMAYLCGLGYRYRTTSRGHARARTCSSDLLRFQTGLEKQAEIGSWTSEDEKPVNLGSLAPRRTRQVRCEKVASVVVPPSVHRVVSSSAETVVSTGSSPIMSGWTGGDCSTSPAAAAAAASGFVIGAAGTAGGDGGETTATNQPRIHAQEVATHNSEMEKETSLTARTLEPPTLDWTISPASTDGFSEFRYLLNDALSPGLQTGSSMSMQIPRARERAGAGADAGWSGVWTPALTTPELELECELGRVMQTTPLPPMESLPTPPLGSLGGVEGCAPFSPVGSSAILSPEAQFDKVEHVDVDVDHDDNDDKERMEDEKGEWSVRVRVPTSVSCPLLSMADRLEILLPPSSSSPSSVSSSNSVSVSATAGSVLHRPRPLKHTASASSLFSTACKDGIRPPPSPTPSPRVSVLGRPRPLPASRSTVSLFCSSASVASVASVASGKDKEAATQPRSRCHAPVQLDAFSSKGLANDTYRQRQQQRQRQRQGSHVSMAGKHSNSNSNSDSDSSRAQAERARTRTVPACRPGELAEEDVNLAVAIPRRKSSLDVRALVCASDSGFAAFAGPEARGGDDSGREQRVCRDSKSNSRGLEHGDVQTEESIRAIFGPRVAEMDASSVKGYPETGVMTTHETGRVAQLCRLSRSHHSHHSNHHHHHQQQQKEQEQKQKSAAQNPSTTDSPQRTSLPVLFTARTPSQRRKGLTGLPATQTGARRSVVCAYPRPTAREGLRDCGLRPSVGVVVVEHTYTHVHTHALGETLYGFAL
ncbi:hypothetical protein BCV70DRAFT_119107 [Testicularia cyperi]|uniref:Uncharacterized protein n=1 Tax=Testicularia cyperi TaxID=1882483 RepID=A0A317XQA1_9BASI|nr:hypothetical protein BCV70DRAFT_119107 [Testicularia cyperi]